MTPEGKVKKKVLDRLKAQKKLWYFMPVSGGFGKHGVPDIVVCARGHFIGIECKGPKGKLTGLQEIQRAAISVAGGNYIVVDGAEESFIRLDTLLRVFGAP